LKEKVGIEVKKVCVEEGGSGRKKKEKALILGINSLILR